jgi:IS30 family transposase
MSKKIKKYKHLSEKERFVIEKLWGKGTSIRGIALILDRSPNTISRELKRCKYKYKAEKAGRHAYLEKYWRKRNCMKVAMDSFLNRFVREKLKEKWSPKQMSGYLKNMNINVSPKAIYKFVCSRGLEHLLFWGWNKHKSGRKEYRYNQMRDDRKYIDERGETKEVGHYEMDFIVSKQSKWVLLVLVEMLSKNTIVRILPNRKHATINRVLSEIFFGKTVLSITTDNDIAFSDWKAMERLLNTKIYFCHPYHSWEKGLVENTNRWIRCFVHKKRDISTVTEKELYDIHSFLNDRPREIIGFQFPSMLYYQLTESVLLEG